jgi:acid phosphatase type 7
MCLMTHLAVVGMVLAPMLFAVPGPSNEVVLLAAGDIASCASRGDEATGRLLDQLDGTIAGLGDYAYPNGSARDYRRCFEPNWGRFKARIRPAAGNHEYRQRGAKVYFDYFGAAAGDPRTGYYSYNLRSWHIVVLNSNCRIVACAAGSAQERWLRADLAANGGACTLAYWHHPLFTSGANHGSATETRPLFQALYDAGAEVVLAGHNHNYERFAPQTPAGALDTARGIRQFVVGTGGGSHYGFRRAKRNSEVRDKTAYGILKLTLRADAYEWRFVPVAGKSFTDAGTAKCH